MVSIPKRTGIKQKILMSYKMAPRGKKSNINIYCILGLADKPKYPITV